MTDPYFFLSYARHPRTTEEDSDDPDRWTLQFFQDLTYEIAELTTLPRGTQPGFMDRELRLGQEWPRRISEALAACRVFVPLYTPRYFSSLSCASEWYLFQARQNAHEAASGVRTEAIIPVLWLPMSDTELPEAAQALQFDHHAFGDIYARLGFLQLIRIARYKDEYQLAIHALAQHVVRVAHAGAPAAGQATDFTAVLGRFAGAEELFAAAVGTGAALALALAGTRVTDGVGADEAVEAYLHAAHAKLIEWFKVRPGTASLADFDDYYLREVHPAARAALLRRLPPNAPFGALSRPPRLRELPPGGESLGA